LLVHSAAIGLFEVCFFLAVYYSGGGTKGGWGLPLLLLTAALLFSIAPFMFSHPLFIYTGGFSFALCLLNLLFAVNQKQTRREYRYFLAAAAITFVIGGSLFIPSGVLRLLILPVPLLLALSCVKKLLRQGSAGISGSEAVPPAAAPSSADAVSAAEAAGPDEGTLEELEEADGPLPPEPVPAAHTNAITSYKMNTFVPREFLHLLKKETVIDLKLGDHLKQEMTIFFSDIRQFTELFESLSPEEGFKFINSYLTRIVPVIEQYGGFVDKYIGDAIMALFPQSNGADMAVRAAIEIQKKILEYNNHRAKCGYRPLDIGVGIHTGTLILGVVGVHNRMQNTVISDAVNLASRVEGLTKAFGVSMAISGQTFQKLEHPERYKFRYLGNVKVKGKEEPTRVYEILNGIDPETMEKKMRTNMYFEQGLFSFVQKKYGIAMANFKKVLEIMPNDLAANIYLEHCFEKLGPADVWRKKDG
ncbi:MAG: adenylate/guanylate cyclase domain-containing protein, partial [Treponema sp.]|nr:adenylate/guanylate cyclase domain-containing protein [Treponema sp.]